MVHGAAGECTRALPKRSRMEPYFAIILVCNTPRESEIIFWIIPPLTSMEPDRDNVQLPPHPSPADHQQLTMSQHRYERATKSME